MSERSVKQVYYAVGDVHGCYDLLSNLLEKIVEDIKILGDNCSATVVFLGDYIDRGPDSSKAVSSLIWLARNAPMPCIFLQGNHEQAMLDFLQDPLETRKWLQVGGEETVRSYGASLFEEMEEPQRFLAIRDSLLDNLPASHMNFLSNLRPMFQTGQDVFVHAGIRPGIPIEEQNVSDLLWIRGGFLDHDQPFDKRVIHGHSWSGDTPELRGNRIGVDTGAYQTGVLTALRIIDGETKFLQARTKLQ
jgi:serine/threonine protein phosphatase 1